MAIIKYINSKLKQKNRKKRTKTSRNKKSNGFLSRKIPQNIKIFNICRLRIIKSTQEEQNNQRFIRKIICETIEVVYQASFNLLGKFWTKEVKKNKKRLQRNQ